MGEERRDELAPCAGLHRLGRGERGVAALALVRKVSSLGSSEVPEEEPISARELLDDAFPFLVISLTSFVLLSAADIWILGAIWLGHGRRGLWRRLQAGRLYGDAAVDRKPGAAAHRRGDVRPGPDWRGWSARCAPSAPWQASLPCWSWECSCSWEGRYWGWCTANPSTRAARSCWCSYLERREAHGRLGRLLRAVLQFTGHQASMFRVNLLTSPLFFIGALLVVRDYGTVGVAGMRPRSRSCRTWCWCLVAKRKTGMWTHVSISPLVLRKGLSNR